MGFFNQYESALCFRTDFKSVSSVSFPLFVFSFAKVSVYRFISSSLVRDLWPSVAKRSRSTRWNLYFHVSDDNGLFIFNYPMPTPCLAGDLKNTFIQYESALCFRVGFKSVSSVLFLLFVLSFAKVLVYRSFIISSCLLWILWPSVAKTSRSNR